MSTGHFFQNGGQARKMQKNHFFCRNGLYTCWYRIYQEAMRFWKLFGILVHPRVQSDLWMEMRKKGHKRANIFLSWKRDEESMVVRRASKDGQRTPQVVLEKLLGGAPPPLLSLVTTHPVLLSHWSSWFQSLRVVIRNESSSYATKHGWSHTICVGQL